jgi:uncharacterized protein with ATP-grasp and redox domains
MKIQKECIPCLLKRIIYETDISTSDDNVKTKAIKIASKKLSEAYDHNECSAIIATKVHQVVYEALNDNDPYSGLKELSNEVAISLLPKVNELIEKADNPLKISILCSIIGNSLDFGIDGGSSHPEKLIDLFDLEIQNGLGYDETNLLENLLSESKNVLFFTDNCGEFVFDKLLCKQIKKRFPEIQLTLVVKGKPVLSDATMDDADDLKFDDIVDEILTTGCFAVGLDFNKLPNLLRNRLDSTDLIICKGMANYEVFSETDYKPIAYLLRTKCAPIARSMKLEENINAVKIYK